MLHPATMYVQSKWCEGIRPRKHGRLAHLRRDSVGVVDVVLNVASISRHSQIDVTLYTPGSAPRVTNDPVGGGNARVGVTNSLHAVVGAPGARAHHARVVSVPALGSDANRWRASGVQDSLQGSVFGVSVSVAVDVLLLAGRYLAGSAVHGVRVISGRFFTAIVLDRSLVNILRITTVATVVIVGA